MNTETQMTEEQEKQLEKLKNYVSPFKLDRLGETRVIYSKSLKEAIQISMALGFNADGSNIDLNLIDIGKGHVVTLIVEDHKKFNQIAGENIELPKHHRVLLQLCTGKSEEPYEIYFDILDSMWSALPLASEYVKVLEQLQSNGTKIVSTVLGKWTKTMNIL